MSTINLEELYINAFGMSIYEFYLMSEEDRVTLYNSLSAEELDSLSLDLSQCGEELVVAYAELEATINSTAASTADIARAEYFIEIVEGMQALAQDISTDYGDGQSGTSTDVPSTTSVEAGTTTTFAPDETPANGQEYTIEQVEEEAVELASTDPHADDEGIWVDTDGDGYTDKLAKDEDGNYYDTNGDEQINELDMLNAGDTLANTTVVIDIPEGYELSGLASYDSETGDSRWAFTNGTDTYFVTVKGFMDIRFNGDLGAINVAAVKDTYAHELLHRIYENPTTEWSFGGLAGVENPAATIEYYNVYDMDQVNNAVTVDPTSEDFANSRSYVINCEEGTQDNITLDFPDDCTLTFNEGENGALIITATNPEGESVTVTINNWQTSMSAQEGEGYVEQVADAIQITGGIVDASSLSNIASLDQYEGDGTSALYSSTHVASIITYEDTDLLKWYYTETGERIYES